MPVRAMSDFELHPRLAADTSFIADWALCRVLLMEDARYPWLVLVPRRAGLVEITGMTPPERALLMEEAARAGAAIQALCAKLNIGALGNLVPQLHLHVVGRSPGDAAWPGPVWGQGMAVPYDAAIRAARIALVAKA
jgi:diadenosine tetraphosphate (Ap4A) HIT family hydrolase